MLRDIFTNKWILGSIALLIIIAGGCYFWYQHSLTDDRKAAAETEQYARQWEKNRQASVNTVTQYKTKAPADSITPTAEKNVNEVAAEVGNNTKAETQKQSDTPAAPAEVADVPTSPYGFGPYPEIPDGFEENVVTPIWIKIARYGMPSPDIINVRNIELIQRVMIKLWQDDAGTRRYMEGGFYRNGKVYVNYSNRAYVRYKTIELPDGTQSRVMTSWTGGSLKSPTPDPANPFRSNSSEIPGEIELIDLDAEDPGIDPYTFLGL